MREISKEDKLKLNLNSKNFETKGKRRAISPIIATLLLILIAIAAGVLVYAYVTGFIGNTTTNSGGTLNTISIDQLFLSSKPSAFPVTAFVRNQGPGTESFNTGFYLKGGSVNYQLGPAVIVSGSGTTDTVTAVSLAYASSTSLTVTVTGCSSTDTMTIKGFGNSASAACSSGTASVTLSLTGSGFTVSSGFSATSGSFTGERRHWRLSRCRRHSSRGRDDLGSSKQRRPADTCSPRSQYQFDVFGFHIHFPSYRHGYCNDSFKRQSSVRKESRRSISFFHIEYSGQMLLARFSSLSTKKARVLL